jgi:hypothetical protein
MLVYVTKLSGGWGGLSFQCLRPSASLRAAGKNILVTALKDFDDESYEF